MRVAEGRGEFVGRFVKLLEGRVDIFRLVDPSGCEQAAPMPGKFIEQIDPTVAPR